MQLSEDIRSELRNPLGILIKNNNPEKIQTIKEIYAKHIVITVGDATSEMLIKMGLTPFLQIVDGREKRHDRKLPSDDSIITNLHCNNPCLLYTSPSPRD